VFDQTFKKVSKCIFSKVFFKKVLLEGNLFSASQKQLLLLLKITFYSSKSLAKQPNFEKNIFLESTFFLGESWPNSLLVTYSGAKLDS